MLLTFLLLLVHCGLGDYTVAPEENLGADE